MKSVDENDVKTQPCLINEQHPSMKSEKNEKKKKERKKKKFWSFL